MTSAQEQKKLRDATQTRLKMSIAMFKAASRGASALQTDVADVGGPEPGAPPALVQVGQRSSSEDWSAEFDAAAAVSGATQGEQPAAIAEGAPDAAGGPSAAPAASLLSEAQASAATLSQEDAEDAA